MKTNLKAEVKNPKLCTTTKTMKIKKLNVGPTGSRFAARWNPKTETMETFGSSVGILSFAETKKLMRDARQFPDIWFVR